MSGVFTFTVFNAGLVATPSPGSIIAIMALSPKGEHLGVLAGVIVAAVVSFVIGAIVLKTSKGEAEDINAAAEKMQELKGKKSSVAGAVTGADASVEAAEATNEAAEFDYSTVKKIIFACDAGMGSSAMGASIMRNKVKKAGVEGVDVTNTSIANLPNDADLVITHKDLTDRAVAKLPNAQHVSVENFMNSPKYDEIINNLK